MTLTMRSHSTAIFYISSFRYIFYCNKNSLLYYYKKRQIPEQIINKKNGMIKIVTGIRRCGKSYLLNVLFRQHLLDEGVQERDIIMLALDEDINIRYCNGKLP